MIPCLNCQNTTIYEELEEEDSEDEYATDSDATTVDENADETSQYYVKQNTSTVENEDEAIEHNVEGKYQALCTYCRCIAK